MNADSIIVDAKHSVDLFQAKQIAEALEQHYPGHLWMVNVDGQQGVATIKAGSLSGEWGYVLHTREFYSVSDMLKQAIMAGGEVLERFKQARGRVLWDEVRRLPTDYAGRHTPDV